MRMHPKNILLFTAVFLLGAASGLFLHKTGLIKEKHVSHVHLKRLFLSTKDLINPLLRVETPPSEDTELEAIKQSVQAYVDDSIKSGKALKISVYLRSLDQGHWIGINENEEFTAASLLKVPLMIIYYKQSQRDPATLKKEIKYEKMIEDMPQNIAPHRTVQLGGTYTVDQLLRYMIVYSDNIAYRLLLENIDPQLLYHLGLDLQIPIPAPGEREYKISPKDYATFFRILYSASYLEDDPSRRALRLLAETEFDEGIAASVPTNITVAHKFAERIYLQGNQQLHDCGIVYAPNNPYLICIMTEGSDLNTLKGVIKDISRIVYERMKETAGVVQI